MRTPDQIMPEFVRRQDAQQSKRERPALQQIKEEILQRQLEWRDHIGHSKLRPGEHHA